MPVFPAVPSTIVPPCLSVPSRSAARIMPSAVLSLTDPPGFINSHLPKISQPVSSERALNRTKGVFPMRSGKLRLIDTRGLS